MCILSVQIVSGSLFAGNGVIFLLPVAFVSDPRIEEENCHLYPIPPEIPNHGPLLIYHSDDSIGQSLKLVSSNNSGKF
jgi:hypothetical protein